jgi:hypothetical protein
MKINPLLLFGILLISSCASIRTVADVKEMWQLEFEKGGCLDVCQAYTIEIQENGTFKYKGSFKVKHLGLKDGVLEPTELTEINRLVGLIDWQNMNVNYGNNSNGSQLKVLEYISKKNKNKTTYYNSEPQSVKDLEHYIDIIIDKDEF